MLPLARQSLAHCDIGTQLREFETMITSNQWIETLLERLADLDLPGSRSVYEAKTARWLAEWPLLVVLPWPSVAERDA